MSAIAGIINIKDTVPRIYGEQMMQALNKFPADDIQIWNKDNVFLGCHAQWITPESIGEVQPYYDYERQLVITSDAMIDNREDLFDKLGVHREERKDIPDGKLILLAYSKWGDEVVKHLIGDFAFMIWDERRQKLFGARDFSGTRSLYYHHNYERFAFCTVMNPLLKLPYIKKQINEDWLAEFLAIPNMIDSVDVSQTVITDIMQIPPSHTITVINGKLNLSKYHALKLDEKVRFKNDYEYIEAFREIFQESVDSRLRTYKSVGSQLSGGLDSGSVVSFASRTLKSQNKRLQTYSSIPRKDFKDWTPWHHIPDERPFIRATVNYVGNIEEHNLSFDDKNSYEDIDEWLEIIETPYKFIENSYWIKGIFEEASKNKNGILLSGARGNFTISWGPGLNYYSHLLRSLRWIRFSREIKSYSRNIGMERSKLLQVIGKRTLTFLNHEEEYKFPMLINPEFAKRMNVYEKLRAYGLDVNGLPDVTYENERKYLLSNEYIWNTNGVIFSKFSLRYGLLMRDPTNDIRVINYCMSLPVEQFINNGMNRALIRKATEGYLPEKVRLNYINYGVQAADWVYRMNRCWDKVMMEAQQLLKDNTIPEYLNMDTLRKVFSNAIKVSEGNFVPNSELRVFMRSIIIYRFLQSFCLEGGD